MSIFIFSTIPMDLIQAKHSYADQMSQWHIYTNTSLWTIWAILDQKGIDISLHDENIQPIEKLNSNIVWINLLWAPYIPVVIETIERLRKQFGNELLFVLGGQVLTQKKSKTRNTLWIDDDQFKSLFGDKVYNGMKPWVLESLLAIEQLPNERTVSLIPMYEKLSDEQFALYFSREISLYVSQWCKFDCEFCGAVKNQREQYREADILNQDIRYIVQRLEKLWLHKLDIYMSNLDVFQSAEQLDWFADMLLNIQKDHPFMKFSLRGLAGCASFIKLDQHSPETIKKLVQAWFNAVGYGVDGMWPEVWKWIKKPQNNEKDILDAIRISKEKYDITPELLMVFGHNGIDTEETLDHAYQFVEAMVQKYGAIPRPHVAKPFIPGNDGWTNPKYQTERNILIETPRLFQSLDFTALASNLTHPDEMFRNIVNHYYLKMCALQWNTTLPIIPYEIWDSLETIQSKRIANIGKFDR